MGRAPTAVSPPVLGGASEAGSRTSSSLSLSSGGEEHPVAFVEALETTTSSSFIAPVATSCLTTRLPDCLYTNGTPPSLTASSGMESTSATLSVSMAFPVVIPGRSVVSACSIRMRTSKTLESWLGRCAHVGDAGHLALESLRGIGVEQSSAWPTAIFRTSISLT